MNSVNLIGRIVRDPELRSTVSGKNVTQFTMAVDRGYGDNKKTDFIQCVAWGSTAEFVCRNFSKGKRIGLSGSLATRSWESDGKKYWVMEGVADRIIHCHAKDINSERRCVSVGTGIVNVKGCIELLKKIGYEGVVSVETEGGGTFEEIVQLATESYNYLNAVIKGE